MVRVELLDKYSSLTITDKCNKSESIQIESLNKMLNYHISYGIHLGLSQKQVTMDNIDFGVGGYFTEKLSENSADLYVSYNI